jgi:hypothetical protein
MAASAHSLTEGGIVARLVLTAFFLTSAGCTRTMLLRVIEASPGEVQQPRPVAAPERHGDGSGSALYYGS